MCCSTSTITACCLKEMPLKEYFGIANLFQDLWRQYLIYFNFQGQNECLSFHSSFCMWYKDTVFSPSCARLHWCCQQTGALVGWWYVFLSHTWMHIHWVRILLSKFYLCIVSKEFDLDVRTPNCAKSGIVSHFWSDMVETFHNSGKVAPSQEPLSSPWEGSIPCWGIKQTATMCSETLGKRFSEDVLLYLSSSAGKNKLLNHADIMRSWRVEVSVTHVMFPVGDCQIHGLVASVVFHLMTSLIMSTFPLHQGLKCLS